MNNNEDYRIDLGQGAGPIQVEEPIIVQTEKAARVIKLERPTRRLHEESKKRRKMAKASHKKNRKCK